MISFIVFFFSAFLSLLVEKVLLKDKHSNIVDLIISWGCYCFFINFFTITILTFFKQISFQLEECLVLYPAIVAKYMLTASFMAVGFALLKVGILKNVGFEIEVKNKKNN